MKKTKILLSSIAAFAGIGSVLTLTSTMTSCGSTDTSDEVPTNDDYIIDTATGELSFSPTVTNFEKYTGVIIPKSITLPETTTVIEVRSIAPSTFVKCTNVKMVSFQNAPEGLTIGEKSFKGLSKLNEINFGINNILEKESFSGCGITLLSIPWGTVVQEQSFKDCINLQSLKIDRPLIPSSTQSKVLDNAFVGCVQLSFIETEFQSQGELSSFAISKNSFSGISSEGRLGTAAPDFDGTPARVVVRNQFVTNGGLPINWKIDVVSLEYMKDKFLISTGDEYFRFRILDDSKYVTAAEYAIACSQIVADSQADVADFLNVSRLVVAENIDVVILTAYDPSWETDWKSGEAKPISIRVSAKSASNLVSDFIEFSTEKVPQKMVAIPEKFFTCNANGECRLKANVVLTQAHNILMIPAQHDEMQWTTIPKDAFAGQGEFVEELQGPYSYYGENTTISNDAFDDSFINLSQVQIQNITKIGEKAFFAAKNIINVTFDKYISEIGEKAFDLAHGASFSVDGANGTYAKKDGALAFTATDKASLVFTGLATGNITLSKFHLNPPVGTNVLNTDGFKGNYTRAVTAINFSSDFNSIDLPSGFFDGNKAISRVSFDNLYTGKLDMSCFKDNTSLVTIDLGKASLLAKGIFVNLQKLSQISTTYSEVPKIAVNGQFDLKATNRGALINTDPVITTSDILKLFKTWGLPNEWIGA